MSGVFGDDSLTHEELAELLSPDELDAFYEHVERQQQEELIDEFERELDSAGNEIAALEQKLGRSLTSTEHHKLLMVGGEQFMRHGFMHAEAAFREMHEREGRAPLDLDKNGDRTDWMTQRFRDMQAAAREQDENEPAPEFSDAYDMGTDGGRRQFMQDRIKGVVDGTGYRVEPEAEEAA